MEINQELIDKIQFIEGITHKISEHEISKLFEELIRDKNQIMDEVLLAETMAFGFHENYLNNDTSWGTYFGPMFVFSTEEGCRESKYS